jgi:hypothetical protein
MMPPVRRGVAPLNTDPNWQIAQARGALEWYYEQFRGIAPDALPDGVSTDAAPEYPPASSDGSDRKIPASTRL